MAAIEFAFGNAKMSGVLAKSASAADQDDAYISGRSSNPVCICEEIYATELFIIREQVGLILPSHSPRPA
jgi:hypothetical protein